MLTTLHGVQGLRILDTACNMFLEDPDKPLLIWENADRRAPSRCACCALLGRGPPLATQRPFPACSAVPAAPVGCGCRIICRYRCTR